MKKIIYYAMTLVCFALITRCSDESLINEKKADAQIGQPVFNSGEKVIFNGSYLEFQTPASFDEALATIKNSDKIQVKEWAQSAGFTSMHAIFQKSLDLQNEYLNSLLSQVEASKGMGSINLPAYIQNHADLFLFDEQGLIHELRMFHPDVAFLVNAEGIVKVAGHLFQYNENNVKIILGGDAGKIALLKRITQSDERENIVVMPVINQMATNEKSQARTSYAHQVIQEFDNPRSFGGRLRTIGTIDLKSYSTPIYGTQQVCDTPCQSPEARVAPCTGTCYYPIIGYNNYTLYKTSMEVQERILWVWKAYRPYYSTISVGWTKNGVRASAGISLFDYSNTYLTVYDGPMVNATYGSHQYLFNLTYSVNGGIFIENYTCKDEYTE